VADTPDNSAESVRRKMLEDMWIAFQIEQDIKVKISLSKQILTLQKSLGMIEKATKKPSGLKERYANK